MPLYLTVDAMRRALVCCMVMVAVLAVALVSLRAAEPELFAQATNYVVDHLSFGYVGWWSLRYWW